MMRKCEVISDKAVIVVGKGSIVFVDDRQFELSRMHLKPIEDEQAEQNAEEKPKKKSAKK